MNSRLGLRGFTWQGGRFTWWRLLAYPPGADFRDIALGVGLAGLVATRLEWVPDGRSFLAEENRNDYRNPL